MITRNQVSDILEKSISLTVDKLYKRDIELIELAASRRMFHKDFQYYSGDRPPIASHMIKSFVKMDLKREFFCGEHLSICLTKLHVELFM